jgi:predicted GNAT family acetyltransferase
MASVSIRKELSEKGGRYVATVEGVEGEAELVFTQRDPALISADHTLAPESMRGTGAALALVEHMIADARTHGFKIVPICPYVRAQYKKHPDWRDVMTVDPGVTPVSDPPGQTP